MQNRLLIDLTMKLLYFTIQINMLGGLAKIVIDKINWLVDHGYDVTLCNIERLEVVPAYPIDSRVKLVRGDITTTPGGLLTRLKGVMGAIKRTKEIIAQERPDVIVNAHCPLVTWILPWIAGHTTLLSKLSPMHPALIVEMHQSRQGLEVFNRQFMRPFARWVHRWSIRWIYSKYDKFVVLTNGDREAWNTKNCVTIPNFATVEVKPQPSTQEESSASAPARHQIILLARLMPQKRIDLMIEVWARLAKDFPGWHVKVLGEGMLREDLEHQAHSLGVADSFLLLGAVKDVNAELEASDILCLTSEYEGFGIVLIEAMLKRVPVMAFEYVGVHDIINDGEDGFVVPFGDTDRYAERLRLLMESTAERERLADNALISVKKFDKEHVMQQWVNLFEKNNMDDRNSKKIPR